MNKVYVVQETNHFVQSASTFGELVFMSNGERDDFVNIAESKHNERLLSHLASYLRDYDPERDFILPIGSPYVQMSVFWILGGLGFHKIRILRWDGRNKGYTPLVLNVRKEMTDDRPR